MEVKYKIIPMSNNSVNFLCNRRSLQIQNRFSILLCKNGDFASLMNSNSFRLLKTIWTLNYFEEYSYKITDTIINYYSLSKSDQICIVMFYSFYLSCVTNLQGYIPASYQRSSFPNKLMCMILKQWNLKEFLYLSDIHNHICFL